MSDWRTVLAGLEPETRAAFGRERDSYYDANDVSRAVAHSQAVSAAKSNIYLSAHADILAENTEMLRQIQMEIQAVQTYGLKLAK